MCLIEYSVGFVAHGVFVKCVLAAAVPPPRTSPADGAAWIEAYSIETAAWTRFGSSGS